MSGKSWYLRPSEEEVKKIVELYNDGYSSTEIGNRYGIHKTTVIRIVRRYETQQKLKKLGGSGNDRVLGEPEQRVK